MSLLSKLFKRENKSEKVPNGVCPNCWGTQEYENVIREKLKDAQIDINNKKARYSFIKDFVVTHLDGIKLKNTINGMECPTCKLLIK